MQRLLEKFFYKALNSWNHEIRLVHLQPRVDRATIECEIMTASLDEMPAFEALSYEWGSTESGRRQVLLNGNPIQVRENLWWALYHLRDLNQPRILWIDALSINQDDIRERNYQVGQMDKIYSQATRVVAWVGREHTRETNILLMMATLQSLFFKN